MSEDQCQKMERKQAHQDDVVERLAHGKRKRNGEDEGRRRGGRRRRRRCSKGSVGKKLRNSSVLEEMRRQTEKGRRLVIEGEARLEQLQAVIQQMREENQILIMTNTWGQLLAHEMEFLIFP